MTWVISEQTTSLSPSGGQFGAAILRVNPEGADSPLFDRKGWRRLQFGAIAGSVNERVEPSDAAEEVYVGLDDLDPGNLHIRHWGKGSDVIGTKLRFRRGDIIFGRRRAYQRKLAVAEMDGICSAHAMVARAKPDVVLPEFLPFLMMSDKFMNRAVEISVGSLSPTINWSTLKLEEFDLPSLDQQRRIAEILWVIDAVQQQHSALKVALGQARTTLVEEHLRVAQSSAQTQELSSVADISYGITLGGHRGTLPQGCPYLRVANVLREHLDLREIKTVNCSENEAIRLVLMNGDVLVVEGHASADEIGRAAVWHGELQGMLHQNHLIRVRCSDTLLPDYVSLCLNSSGGRRYMRSRAKSSSGLNTINSTVVKEFPLPMARIGEQAQLVTSVHLVDAVSAALDGTEAKAQGLLCCFLNEAFR